MRRNIRTHMSRKSRFLGIGRKVSWDETSPPLLADDEVKGRENTASAMSYTVRSAGDEGGADAATNAMIKKKRGRRKKHAYG